MPIKFLGLGGVNLVFLGGSANFIFVGAGIFLIYTASTKRLKSDFFSSESLSCHFGAAL